MNNLLRPIAAISSFSLTPLLLSITLWKGAKK